MALAADLIAFSLFYRRSNHHTGIQKLWECEHEPDRKCRSPVCAERTKAPSSNGGDQLDKAGQSILNLLHKAAGVARKEQANTRWTWLRSCLTSLCAAEQRITDLEAEVETHRDRAGARRAVAPG